MARNILKYYLFIHLLVNAQAKIDNDDNNLPLVIVTWEFLNATEKAWNALNSGTSIDAVETGCSTCESMQCDGTVGFGGSPDENGETTLDAMIMDGSNLNVGAVAGLRRIKSASSVARHVLEHTKHTLIVGDQATQFAIQMGFHEETLQTSKSYQVWKNWLRVDCQPNFWMNVLPDPTEHCGPYRPSKLTSDNEIYNFDRNNHDTVGIIAIDENGHIVAGTSTNGARHKIAGRVGDSPIPGAGAYADNDVGAAAATGDGDVMMRILPSFLAVEEMRRGMDPSEAADIVIQRIISKYPNFFGGIIVVNKLGIYGASCHGMVKFPFAVRNLKLGKVTAKQVPCVNRLAKN